MQKPFVLDSQFLSDNKKVIRERIIPWEGLSRANILTEDEANYIKILEKQSEDNRMSTILNQLTLYCNTLLNVLNKLEVNSRDDVVKNLLVLINDLLIELPNQEFGNELIKLYDVDNSLPFEPFLKHLSSNDMIIKCLSLYNLSMLLVKGNRQKLTINKEIVIKIFDTLCGGNFVGNSKEFNYQYLSIQLLQEIIIEKPFKTIFQTHGLINNFKPLNQIINNGVKNNTLLSNSNLQLIYNTLLTIWLLSFNGKTNKVLVHNYPILVGNLLIISKDSIKLKIIRLAVSILKNFIGVDCGSQSEQFKIIKLLLFNDGLNIISNLRERKFSSNGSDEELSIDVNFVFDSLNDVVKNKLTSLDEYLTELENPNLISWSSPTHKSLEFWLENCEKFSDLNFKLVKRMVEILSTCDNNVIKIILLNDLQHLINNLKQPLITFINTTNNGEYKFLIMNLLDNNDGDNELKFQALKTTQLLVGHNY